MPAFRWASFWKMHRNLVLVSHIEASTEPELAATCRIMPL